MSRPKLAVCAAALTFGLAASPTFSQPASPTPRRIASEAATRPFAMRDGVSLHARVFGDSGGLAVVMLHGVADDGANLSTLAARLNRETGAQVLVLDLRGHGRSGGPPFRVAHIGQYEEDAVNVIAALRAQSPNRRIILAGHSMGGGICLRYALLRSAPKVDGYLLLAPLFGGDSPTMRHAVAAEAKAGEAPVRFDVERLTAVAALNERGDISRNDEPIMTFATGPAYGWNALQSMQPNAPADYRAALAAIRAPLLVIAGDRDEAFDASQYAPVVARYCATGKVELIEGATHGGVLFRPETLRAAANWLAAAALPTTAAR